MSDEPTPDPLMQLAQAQVAGLVNLKRDKTIRGEALTIRNMVESLYAVLRASPILQARAEAKAKKVSRPKSSASIGAMDDEAWILHLEAKPHLQGVDVRREIGKCQTHFEALGITASRQRITKWVNRADRTPGYDGRGKTSFAPKAPAPNGEPPGWREWVRENATDPSNADKAWASLGAAAQQYIIGQVKGRAS